MSSSKTKVLICPYCGDTQPASERCRACGGLFEPLSRQASHNAMGPWYVRDEKRPFQPGASYETIVKLIERGVITRYTILRSPTTKQFWTVARRVPGIAHLLGYCHNCDANVGKDDHGCPTCGVPFGAYLDRNYLGLPEVKPLPWEAPVIEDDTRGGGHQRVLHGNGHGHEAMADFRRAAEPLGISSFASDSELRDMASRAPYTPPNDADAASTTCDVVPPAATVTEREVTPASVASSEQRVLTLDSASSVAARSMQRRLQRQQSQIRLLMAMLGLVTVVSIVVMVALIANRAGNGARDRDASGTSENRQAQPAHPAADAQPSSSAPLDSTQPGMAAPSDDLDGPEVRDAAVDTFEQALALIAEARKEDRPLKDRISDVERALERLRALRDRQPRPELPQDLPKIIVDAERLLERLKLQEFFP